MTAARPSVYSACVCNLLATLLFSGALLLTCTQAIADDVLQPYTAEYYLKRDDIILGKATRSLRPAQDGIYIYESVSQATGILSLFIRDRITESSKWTYHESQIRPLEYNYQRGSGDKRKFSRMVFDWERFIVNGVKRDGPWHMPIPSDVSDKLVYQLSIMRDLKLGKKPLHYVIAEEGNLKDYKFEILGEETLSTNIGALHTVKIRRLDDKRNTTVWCASKLNFIPVRLDQTEKDNVELSMQIKSLKDLPGGRSQ